VRRLFSTFVNGRIGAGLLIMRIVAGAALLDQGIAGLRTSPEISLGALHVVAMSTGAFLLVGLGTPVVGILVVALELWHAWSGPGTPWTAVLLATVGGALVLLGPGAWSIDARLFGWRRIEIPDGRHRPPSSTP